MYRLAFKEDLKNMLFKKMCRSLFIFFIFLFNVYADQNEKITLDLKNISIQDAIHRVAEKIHENIIISPAIHGMVSIQFKNMNAIEALDALLLSNQLAKWRIKHVWYIGKQAEILKYKEDALKFKTRWDETSALITRVWQIRYAKADTILAHLENHKNSLLSKRGLVRSDTRTNILYVKDTETHLSEIDRLIDRLDIPIKQMMIDATLVSMNCDVERDLGIQFSAVTFDVFNIAKLKESVLLKMQLSALEKEGHAEIISSPRLFTANLETASIESGEEIPYQEISESGVAGQQFKKAVLSLKVTPQIMPGNQVLLDIQVNQDQPNKREVLGVPAITTRQMRTHIMVKNGQTIVLGGIYEANKELEQQSIPFLGKIPLVGWIFRQQNGANTKRELLIFVTPSIIA